MSNHKRKHTPQEYHLCHPLPYISPWKLPDSNRENIQYQQAKNKLLNEINVISKNYALDSLRSTNICSSQEKDIAEKKDLRTRSRTLNDFKEEYNRSKAKRLRNYKQHRISLTKKEEEMKKLQDSIVFVRKTQLSSKMRVVSVGSEPSPDQFSSTTKIRKQQPQMMPFSISVSCYSAKIKQNSLKNKRMAYKNISISLLNKLKSSKEQPLDTVLGTTLQNFIKQQTQI